MHKIIRISELRNSLRSFLEEVIQKKTPIILTRGKHPEAALISYEDFLHYQEIRESESILRFHERRLFLERMSLQYGDE